MLIFSLIQICNIIPAKRMPQHATPFFSIRSHHFQIKSNDTDWLSWAIEWEKESDVHEEKDVR